MVMVTDQYYLVTYIAITREVYLNVHEQITTTLVMVIVRRLMEMLQQFSVIVSIIFCVCD